MEVELSQAPSKISSNSTTGIPVHSQTALPDPMGRPEPTLGPALTVRATGTYANAKLQPFERPFEMHYSEFPVQLDRNAFASAGFGDIHAHLLPVLSNSCAIRISKDHVGQIKLHSTKRKSSNGLDMPMYFDGKSLLPLPSEVIAEGRIFRLVVNNPIGVVDSQSGQRLAALAVELQQGA